MPALPFVLAWRGQPVAGFSEVSGLSSVDTPVDYRADGASDTRAASSPRAPEPLTLRRGVVHDPAFAAWLALPLAFTQDAVTPDDRRRDLELTLRDHAGAPAASCTVRRCWPSAVVALPAPAVDGDTVAVEELVMQHEGWAWEVGSELQPPPS